MGYRSQVEILVRGETLLLNVFRAEWIEKAKAMTVPVGVHFLREGQSVVDEHFNLGEVKNTDAESEWSISFGSIKWYPDYPEIKAYMMILHDCPEQLAAELVRVGEEEGDIETQYGGSGTEDPVLYTSTSIMRY